jgi:TonB family protein
VVSYTLASIEVEEPEPQLREIPDRFAKLIVDKPVPKKEEAAVPGKDAAAKAEEPGAEKEETPDVPPARKKAKKRAAAKKAVAARAAKVEKKIRTVGVLGMLTGEGATAKGPGVVDVLGAVGKERKRSGDLDKALESISGLQRASDATVVKKKLVKSKDVAVEHTESIDDLVASIGKAQPSSLSKKGTFMIRRPESIEGAASSHAKRDDKAVGRVVRSHKMSIRMSYERYLKRDPSLAGKITVRFTISANGRVSRVEILENTTGSDGLERDIKRKVRMWRFEPIGGGDVTVTYPFVFRPS